jgi:hypothetical protein
VATFYTGKVCARHPELEGERNASNATCPDCARASVRKYRAAHSEQRRKWREANRKKERERARKYREANAEKVAERHRKYRAANAEKVAERHRKYQAANAEKVYERKRKYYEANQEKLAERARKYYEANRENFAECKRKWRAANAEKIAADAAERRALKINATPPLTLAQKEQIIARYVIAQQLNSLSAPGTYHVDHIIPLSKGGLHHPDNLRVIRAVDNLRKSARPAGEVPVAFEMTAAPSM